MSDAWTMKKTTVEQYEFRGPYGMWAIVTLDPRGVFQAVSDVGDYAYAGWGHHGCESFKHFLVSLREEDYFLSKTARKQFAFDRTITEIRRRLLDARRERTLDRVEASLAWGELEEIAQDHTSDATYFVHQVMERENLYRALGEDPCEVPTCEEWPAWPRRFFKEIFRERLVPALQAEIAEKAS